MPINHLGIGYEVYKLSYRVWEVLNEDYGNLVYYNNGFKCTCPRFIRTGKCDDIRMVLRNNNEEKQI